MIYQRPMWQKLTFISLAMLLSVGCFLSLAVQTQAEKEQTENPSEENAAAFVDGAFNPVLGGGTSALTETVLQPDGKILVSGSFNVINGATRNSIARFNADGTLDVSFNTGSGADNNVTGMSLQSNGKIIVGGTFTNFNGVAVGRIARLNADGSIDQTFNTLGVGVNSNVGAGGEVAEIKVLSDDKILIGGAFTTYNGATQNRLARLNANGTLDTSFAVGTGPSAIVSTIEVQADGKAIIGGNFVTYNAVNALRLARINTDGTLDTGFPTALGANSTPRFIVAQAGGKILVGGSFSDYGGTPKNGLVRLNSDGTVDSTFNVTGTGATIFGIGVQPDGKLIVGGNFTAISGGTRTGLARLNADGTFDASYDSGTGIGATFIQDLALQSDGKVVIVGSFLLYNGVARGGVARVNNDGSLDTSMPVTSSLFGTINAMAVQTDGKIVVGGNFTSVNGVARTNIARLNADGTIDSAFNPGSGAGSPVLAVAVQTDGKIIVGGGFTTFNGATANRIARLNADGTLDTSFNVGTGAANSVNVITIQPADGKILLGGLFTTFNAITVNRLVRLNTDGTLDTTLMTGTGFGSTVNSIAVQANNKILIGGAFTTVNGTTINRIARINTDGTLDTTFTPGTGANSSVLSMVVQADGKVVIGGNFTTYNAITRNRIARINSDGSLDTAFDTGTGTNGVVNTVSVLSNGKSLIAGDFTTITGLQRNRVARLNANGSFDPTFVTGLGANLTVNAMVSQADGKILVGGGFRTYNVNARTGIARFSNVSDATVDFDGDGRSDYSILRRPFPPIGAWTWWIRESDTARVTVTNFGLSPNDFPQPGDYDGDGKDDIAMWRNTPQPGQSCAYYIIQSSTNTVRIVPFGLPGDLTMVQDYDGDGKDDLSVWRAPTVAQGVGQATWYYLGSLNNPNNNITYVPWGIRYGTQSDQVDDPYPGDFDGDGRADFRVQRRADITVATSNTPAIFYTLTAAGNVSYDYFGLMSDRIVPGDYDGDGKTDICVVRGFNLNPSDITWYIQYTTNRPYDAVVFGRGSNFNFAQGDYDGDGKTDISLFVGDTFWTRAASNGTVTTFRWGQAGDLPVAVYNNL